MAARAGFHFAAFRVSPGSLPRGLDRATLGVAVVLGAGRGAARAAAARLHVRWPR